MISPELLSASALADSSSEEPVATNLTMNRLSHTCLQISPNRTEEPNAGAATYTGHCLPANQTREEPVAAQPTLSPPLGLCASSKRHAEEPTAAAPTHYPVCSRGIEFETEEPCAQRFTDEGCWRTQTEEEPVATRITFPGTYGC